MATESRQSSLTQIIIQLIVTLGLVAVGYLQFAAPRALQEAKTAGAEAAKPAADKALDERIDEVAELRAAVKELQAKVQGMKVQLSLGNCKSPTQSWEAASLTPKPGEVGICAPGYLAGGVNPQNGEAVCCTYGIS